jgi:N-acyl amino acid synthase FeeM
MKSAAGTTPAAFGRNSDLLDQVDYRLAETPEEKDEIYRLRYRAYLREGAIQPTSDQRVIDQFEDAPNAWTFGVYFQGELYSSIRVSVLTSEWRMSPSVELFGDVLHPKLDQGLVFIDSTRFVADPEKARNFPELPYVTVRLGSMAGVHFNADFGLAIVRAEHQAFYRRLFLQETWCEPRLYPGLVKPVGLMAAHLPTCAKGSWPVIRFCAQPPSNGGCCLNAVASAVHLRPM